MIRSFLKKVFNKVTLKGYRDQLLYEEKTTRSELVRLQQQVFLNNPVLIVQQVKMYLPLFYVDHIQKGIYQNRNFYEVETLEFLRLHYKQFEHVVDIGTNIGNHMLYYCSNLGAQQVFCFEPNQFNREVLEKNIELNHLQKKVTVYPYAVGAEKGKGIQSNFSLGNTGMNRVDKVEAGNDAADAIDIRTLDEFEFKQIDFVKIDVEGFETDVLLGAGATLQRCKPVVLIEVFEKSREQVDTLMQRYGYRKFITLEEYNCIYVPV
jgi:FkbM family methyltransferase